MGFVEPLKLCFVLLFFIFKNGCLNLFVIVHDLHFISEVAQPNQRINQLILHWPKLRTSYFYIVAPPLDTSEVSVNHHFNHSLGNDLMRDEGHVALVKNIPARSESDDALIVKLERLVAVKYHFCFFRTNSYEETVVFDVDCPDPEAELSFGEGNSANEFVVVFYFLKVFDGVAVDLNIFIFYFFFVNFDLVLFDSYL